MESELNENRESNEQKILRLEEEVERLRGLLESKPDGQPGRSPLAPKDGFPELAPIRGVRLATAAAGVHYRERTDVMLARVVPGSTAAAVFTKSATRSASVKDCETKLSALAKRGHAPGGLAILVNSGNANAFTGVEGDIVVRVLADATSKLLDVPQDSIFTASTGVIGVPLRHRRIIGILQELKANLSDAGFEDAARAIMTTDTFPKGATADCKVGGTGVSISGIAKGSGMIAPDMATMLAFVFTDARIEQDILQKLVSDINERTFNSITVDGDTSTSDILIVVATGESGCPKIAEANSKEGHAFASALEHVMTDLAKQVVSDGEGATKFIEVNVTGAASDGDARLVARSIGNSPLVKTAIAGEDPNWGRIVMAVGKAGATADRDSLTIRFGDLLVAERGQISSSYGEEAGASYMKRDRIAVNVDLGLGNGTARIWTCDLTNAYVDINASYRS